MRKNIYVDFTDLNCDDTCIIKYNGNKFVVPKREITTRVAKYKIDRTAKLKSRVQLFSSSTFGDSAVRKYIAIFPEGIKMTINKKIKIVYPKKIKMVIKNVSENDCYYEQMEAFSRYRNKVVFKKDEVYPDFPKESDYEFDDLKSKKR